MDVVFFLYAKLEVLYNKIGEFETKRGISETKHGLVRILMQKIENILKVKYCKCVIRNKSIAIVNCYILQSSKENKRT